MKSKLKGFGFYTSKKQTYNEKMKDSRSKKNNHKVLDYIVIGIVILLLIGSFIVWLSFSL